MNLSELRVTAWAWVTTVWALAAEHPAVTTFIVVAVINALFKPKTPEQYARIASRHPTWFFARVAASLQLLGTLGFDPAKAAKIVTEKILKGPPRALSILLLVALSASTTSCGFLEKHGPAIIDALFEKTQCAIANMHLPNEEIFVRCALTAEDRPHVEAALGAAREAAIREAMAARYDERQYLLGTGACVDAGANSTSDQ